MKQDKGNGTETLCFSCRQAKPQQNRHGYRLRPPSPTASPPVGSEYSAPLDRISETQLTLCDPERQLLPLVLTHCQYTLRKGGATGRSYDLPGIQAQLARRFLAGKPLIQEVKPAAVSSVSQYSRVLRVLRVLRFDLNLKHNLKFKYRFLVFLHPYMFQLHRIL